MSTFRCPHLDQFARDLVEAYRHVENRGLSAILSGRDIPEEVEIAHLAMAEHRRECPLCLKIERARRGETPTLNASKETVE